jgi:filamentous hemagglutinin family protein
MSSTQRLRSAQFSKRWNRLSVVVIALGVFSSVQSRAVSAEVHKTLIAQSIATDGTVGTPQTLTGPNYAIPQAAGQTAGSNLFHSFGQFNINAGESATFQSNPTIRNIFSRVTGRDSSLINGTLATQGQNVNLFFINPNGIVFGPNAQLNVTGSFLATTADRIVFADGTQFRATPSRSSSALTVSVPVGLQFGTRPGSIVVQGRGRAADGRITPLAAGSDQTLALVGGDIMLQGGTLGTTGGKVEVGSVGDGSFVGLSISGQQWTFDYSNILNYRNTQLDGQSTIASQDAGLDSIRIQTGSLTLRDGSVIQSIASEQGRTGNIIVNANDRIVLTGEGERFQSLIESDRSGSSIPIGGDIQINTRSLSVTNGAAIRAFARNNTSGDITINASDIALVEGEGRTRSGIGTVVANGTAGSLNLQAGTVQIRAGGRLYSSSANGEVGVSGPVTINARDAVLLDETARNGNPVAIYSTSSSTLAQLSGAIQINTGSLSITNGAQIYTASEGQANSGNIVIQARDHVMVSGGSDRSYISRSGREYVPASAIEGGNFEENGGNAGNIQITARHIDVDAGGLISASTQGSGNAGNINLNVQELIRIDGYGSDLDGLFRSSQIASLADYNSSGQAGNISVRTTDLQISNGGRLQVSTSGQGQAGNIAIAARNQVLVTGSGARDTSYSDISSSTFGTNNSGTIQIDTGSLRIEQGAQVSSYTVGIGNAGKITVNARDSIVFDGSNSIQFTGISSVVGVLTAENRSRVEENFRARGIDNPTIFDEAVGIGGDIQLNARSLAITNGAGIAASSEGQGPAGNVAIRVSDSLSVNNGTIATGSLTASGGRVSIQGDSVRLRGDSNIATNVPRGDGNGGDITITANSIIALNDSNILSFAQDGRGGNVTLNTRAFFGQNYRPTVPGASRATLISNGRVDINATGAISGIVTLPETSFIQNELTSLPAVLIDTETLLANSCIRRDRATGTFYVSGSGNLPTRPGELPYSTYETAEVRSTTPQAWKPGDAIVEPQGVYTLANGKRVISRLCSGERSS